MSSTKPDRRHLRHAATRQEILDAAWMMAREEGLAGLSLRGLARTVGMEPQSLYTYFASKNAIYNAMFLSANEELVDRLRAADTSSTDPFERLSRGLHAFVEFCTEDQVRYLLLLQRTIPGFTPGEAGMRKASEVLEIGAATLADIGVTDPQALDLLTSVMAGLIAQQTANEPGGTRWVGLLDRVIAMLLRELGVPPEV